MREVVSTLKSNKGAGEWFEQRPKCLWGKAPIVERVIMNWEAHDRGNDEDPTVLQDPEQFLDAPSRLLDVLERIEAENRTDRFRRLIDCV